FEPTPAGPGVGFLIPHSKMWPQPWAVWRALFKRFAKVDNMGILKDRVVIITGAGGGLGAAHARVFAAEGACVLVNDINQAAAQAVVDEIVAAGGRAVVNTSDITHYASSEDAVKQ